MNWTLRSVNRSRTGSPEQIFSPEHTFVLGDSIVFSSLESWFGEWKVIFGAGYRKSCWKFENFLFVCHVLRESSYFHVRSYFKIRKGFLHLLRHMNNKTKWKGSRRNRSD